MFYGTRYHRPSSPLYQQQDSTTQLFAAGELRFMLQAMKISPATMFATLPHDYDNSDVALAPARCRLIITYFRLLTAYSLDASPA